MSHPGPQPDHRLLDAVEAPAAPSAAEHGPDELRLILAQRRQRAALVAMGHAWQRTAPSIQTNAPAAQATAAADQATAAAITRLAAAWQAECTLADGAAHQPPTQPLPQTPAQPLPISTFRIERVPAWERVMRSGWPGRLAIAASVLVAGYIGVLGVSAARTRYVAWQQHRDASRLAAAERLATSGAEQPIAPQPDPSSTRTADAHLPSTTALEPVGQSAAGQRAELAAALPPPSSAELARAGQLVILVRAKSATRMNQTISVMPRRASEVLAAARTDGAWQGKLVASAAESMAGTPLATSLATDGLRFDFRQPALVSYGPMAQSPVPGLAGRFGVTAGASAGAAPDGVLPSGQQQAEMQAAGAQIADWFAGRPATTHLLTVRDQPAAIDGLIKRMRGYRNVKVDVVRLDAPMSDAIRPSPSAPTDAAAAGAPSENLLWWTKPASQWQRLEIPVIVVEE